MSRRIIPEFIEDPHKLSSEEFTRKLRVWFEDQGMMSEIRTHLRARMITSLKATPLGPKALNVGSPKCQAINLIIAEFLVEQQYPYTLSVFSSEVPLKDFSTLTISNLAAGKEGFPDTEPRPRYQQRFVKDILETIGFSPQSEESIKICSLYNDNEEAMSLIACIFRIVSELLRSKHGFEKKVFDEKNNFKLDMPTKDTDSQILNGFNVNSNQNFGGTEAILNTEILNIISLSTLKTEHIHQLHNEIKKIICTEVSRVQQEEESKYKQELLDREKNIQENLVLRETFFQQLVEDSNARIENERQDMLKGRQEMKELAGQLRERHCQLVARCTELEEWGQLLKSKEIQIEELKHQETLRATEKNSQLDFRKHQLDLEIERLTKEHEELELQRQGVIELKRSLENAHINVAKEAPSVYNLQEECIYLRKQLDSARNLLKKKSLVTAEKESQQLIVNETQVDKGMLQQMLLTKELCRQLQQENGELRARTRQQDRRIDELTTRAADLVAQLEDAKIALIDLSSQKSQVPFSGHHLVSSAFPDQRQIDPLLPQVPPVSKTRARDCQRMGAGEELLWENHSDEINRPVTNTQVSRSVQTKEPRKKSHRRLAVYKHVSSEESSPTEEILVEAKRRLRTLEEESEAVDRKFREFRERQPVLYSTSQYAFSSYPYKTKSSFQNVNVVQQSSYSRLDKSFPTNSKISSGTIHHQEPEVYAQSRFGRMTDLLTNSSSDAENSYAISQLSPVSSRGPVRNLSPERLVTRLSPTPIAAEGMQSKRLSPSVGFKVALSSQNEKAEIETSIQFSAPASRISPYPLLTTEASPNLNLASTYDSALVSHSVEVHKNINENIEERGNTDNKNLEYFSPGKKTLDSLLTKERSNGDPPIESKVTSDFDRNESILVYMNAAPARHSSDSEEDLPSLMNLAPIATSISRTIADIARENAERDRDQSGVETMPPLEHPDSRLEPLRLEPNNAVLLSSTVRDSNATALGNKSVKKKKSLTAVSGTTSGSGFESSLPALQNISISSIELSSDQAASDANTKGKGSANSEDDFWA